LVGKIEAKVDQWDALIQGLPFEEAEAEVSLQTMYLQDRGVTILLTTADEQQARALGIIRDIEDHLSESGGRPERGSTHSSHTANQICG
jgi:hypothetical protein